MPMLALMPLLFVAAAPGCSEGIAPDLPETTHEHVARDVSVAVEEGAALVTISDRLRPEGSGVALTSFPLELAAGRAVVVDAWLTSRHGRVRSKILPAGVADRELEAFERALTRTAPPDASAPDGRGPPQAALLVRHVAEGADVRIAAPCGLGEVRVHLRVQVASDPEDDRWRFELPGTPGVAVRRLRVPGRAFRRERERTVVVRRREHEPRGRVESRPVPADGERHLLRAELDLPRRLASERPLAFVFVVDRSVSFGADRFAAGALFVESMLREAPAGSAYAVVTMARRPRVDVSPWTPASRLAPLRALGEQVALENGSDVVAALELAKRVVADAGEREGRVVLVSDLERASAVSDQRVAGALAKGRALTHVLRVYGEGIAWWSRSFADDGHPLAAGAEASGGVFIDASLVIEEPDAELASYFVRPTLLERPRLVGARGHEVIVDSGLPGGRTAADRRAPWLVVEADHVEAGSDSVLPAHLEEGAGLRVTGLVRPLALADELAWRVEGLLWASPSRYSLSSSPATERLLPALAAVNEVAGELSDDAVLALSLESGAVSRTSSRLALPRWRPPVTEEPSGYGTSCGCGGGTMSGFGTSGVGCAVPVVDSTDRGAEIERWLAGSRAACGPSGQPMRVEWRSSEVLEVAPAGAYGPAERCYREALWDLRLDLAAELSHGAYSSPGAVIVRLPD